MTSSVAALDSPVRDKRRAYIILILFLIGLYIPTSIGGVQSSALVALPIPLFLLGFAPLLALNGMGNYWLRAIGFCIPATVLLCSFLSPFPISDVGPIYSYCMLGLLYTVKLNVEGSEYYPVLSKGLLGANLISVILGVGIILQYGPIMDFLIEHYTYFYPDLLPVMFTMRKPVLTFCTHSVAGFFLFLFFWMNLRTYEVRRKISNLCFAIIYLIFSLFLFSFTSLFFFVWEAIFLLRLALKRSWKLTLVGVLILGSAGLVLSSSVDKDLQQWLAGYAESVLQSQGNGLAGRYSSATGDLTGNLAFLHENPWRPVGVTGSTHLFFVDSGPIEYLLRGSVPLLLLIYSGCVIFLTTNLKDKEDMLVMIGAVLVFEIGFAILPFARMMFAFPFLITYLNALQSPSAQATLPANLRLRNSMATG